MLRILFVFLLFAGFGGAKAETVMLDPGDQQTIIENLRYLEDPDAQLDITDIRNPDLNWLQHSGSSFNKSFSQSTWWLHLQLNNPQNRTEDRLLEISYAILDYVDIYVFSNHSQISHFTLGDRYPYADRPIDSPFFVVPLHWSRDGRMDVYMRIKSSSAIQVPLTLWQPDTFTTQAAKTNIIQGLYYGAMLVIVVYNLLIFLALWDRSYLYYSGFVLSMPLFFAAISGQGFRYIWPDIPGWNDYALTLFLALTVIFANLFTRLFLDLKKVSPLLNYWTLIVTALAVIGLGLVLFSNYRISILYLVAVSAISAPGSMVAGVVSWRRGAETARFYCVAWALFLLGVSVLVLNKINILPNNQLTQYSVQIGSILEAVLLSFAMAERINVERKLRYQAQDETLTTTRRLNAELETRVQERTDELEQLNKRLRVLSNTDQLTGLYNRRYLEQKMQSEWERCKRYKHSMAMVMMDVDYFKKVNDTYGHPAGDECLRQVTAQILGCVRVQSDHVARYGGEEFCMLLPETDTEGAVVLAERIRTIVASHPIVTQDHVFNVTISLGVFAMIPNNNQHLGYMLQCVDLALYQSKENGRNLVTVFDPDHSNPQKPNDEIKNSHR